MQYSLLSRFQGCLSGMMVGEILGRAMESEAGRAESAQLAGSRVAIAFLEQVIRVGHWIDWRHWAKERGLGSPLSSGEWAIATVPIALFFHEDLVKQRQILGQILEDWRVPGEHCDRVITFAYAIAQALKRQIDPRTFIAQTLAYLRLSTASTPSGTDWMATLEALNTELKTDQNESQVLSIRAIDDSTNRRIAADAIALALYTVLSTPENLSLAVLRSIKLSAHPALAGALTGAIAGAHTGHLGIPPDWTLLLNPASSGRSSPPSDAHSIPSLPAIATQILAIWAGLYPPSAPSNLPLAVMAPWVLRQR